MSTHTTIPPVRRSVTVNLPVDRAFALFTTQIDRWWPSIGTAGPVPAAGSLEMEPRPQGQVYRRLEDGSIDVLGEVAAWEPPRLIVLAVAHGGYGQPRTDVEISFTPAGNGTEVALEHRGFERFGGEAAQVRNAYDAAWMDALRAYQSVGQENHPAIAALVLGLASLFLPIVGLVAAPFAIVFGWIGRRRARRGARRGGMATVGLTLGSIGLVLWAVILAGGLSLVIVQPGGQEEQVPVEQAPTPQEGLSG